MSTGQTPPLDMDKLNACIGQFVTDLGAAVHTGMVVIGEKLGLYKALAAGPMTSAELAAKTKTDEALFARMAFPRRLRAAMSPMTRRRRSSVSRVDAGLYARE